MGNHSRLAVIALGIAMALPPLISLPVSAESPAVEDQYKCNDLVKTKAQAEQGNSAAQDLLGEIYLYGKCNSQQDRDQGMNLVERAANKGNLRAESTLASVYRRKGDGANALKWARKAADAHAALGEINLAFLYFTGIGVPKDDTEAAKWARKASEQGDGNGEALLGWLYHIGSGVPHDDVEAAKLIRHAADQGNASGESELARFYHLGIGTAKDDVKAARLARKSAVAGDNDAASSLAWQYYRGEGVPKDEAEAAKWARRAANQGNHWGMNLLARLYRDGQGGLRKDAVQADKWYLLSSKMYNFLLPEIARFEQTMQPGEIAAAHKLADDWKPDWAGVSYPDEAQ